MNWREAWILISWNRQWERKSALFPSLPACLLKINSLNPNIELFATKPGWNNWMNYYCLKLIKATEVCYKSTFVVIMFLSLLLLLLFLNFLRGRTILSLASCHQKDKLSSDSANCVQIFLAWNGFFYFSLNGISIKRDKKTTTNKKRHCYYCMDINWLLSKWVHHKKDINWKWLKSSSVFS